MTGIRLFLSLLIALILSIAIFAQSKAVSGVISDSAGRPIAGASVALRNKRTGLERVVFTDEHGRFSFSQISDDEFEVIVSAVGFGRVVKEIAGLAEAAIMLEPAAINEKVTVFSGSRQEELRESLTTKVDVISARDIKSTGYETVGEVLREVPGVVTRRGSETSPVVGEQVQGIDSRQVLVLLDGQPVTGARGVKSGIVNLDHQQVGHLDSVEVVKGAASALYGSDAIGGVINLRTYEQTEPLSASATVAGGNFGVFDGRGSFGFVKDRLSGYLTAGRHKNNGFDLFPSDFTTDGSGYHRWDGYGKIKYQLTDNFSIVAFANSYWNNSKGRAVGEPTDFIDFGRQIIDVDDDAQDYGVTADWAIDGKTNLQVRGYLSRFDEIYRSVGYPSGRALPDGNLFERLGKFDLTFSRIIGERHFLQAGAEFTANRYSGIGRLQNDLGEANTQVVWLQDKISITRRLTLTAGGRLDHHSEFGTAVAPKIGINYRLAEFASLRASWGRGFRAPDLGQLFYKFANPLFRYQVLGNSNLRPEHSGSWQIGGEFHALSRKARFGVNFFRNDVANLISSESLGTVPNRLVAEERLAAAGLDPSVSRFIDFFPVQLFAYLNLANIYTQGFEVDSTYLIGHGFAASGAYTFLEAINKETGRPLTGRHKHHGFAKIGYDNARSGLTLNFRGTFFGDWWASSSRKAPAFQLFDIYGAKRLWKGFELYGTIDNLFNSQDPNTGVAGPTQSALPLDRADAGRTFRIGMRWDLNRRHQ
ncbi:MAG: TonB-dependent receptor [Pyrinomonadaceae bacterium]